MSSNPPKDWMWAQAVEMLDRAERRHRQFFSVAAASGTGPTWEPPVDVIETPEEVAVVVALPGVQPGHVEVAVEADVLIVRGARPLPKPYRVAAIHRMELPHGRFERRLRMLSQRLQLTRRDLADGCLTLVFRKLA